LPWAAKEASKPGWGKSTTSGAVPASMAVLMEASKVLEPWYWMVMPVLATKSAMVALNLTASWSTNGPVAGPALALNLPAMARSRKEPLPVVGALVAAGAAVAGALVGCGTA